LKNDLPKTYEAWLYRQLGKKSDFISQWKGAEIIEVEVNPDDFTRYCDATNSNRTIETLDRFATVYRDPRGQGGLGHRINSALGKPRRG
jgi:hypothetical protein